MLWGVWGLGKIWVALVAFAVELVFNSAGPEIIFGGSGLRDRI
jgi:hypothetical protein